MALSTATPTSSSTTSASPGRTAQPTKNGQDGDGRQPTGKTGERFKVACGCQPPRSFWIRAKQYTPGPITCGVCGQDFDLKAPPEATDRTPDAPLGPILRVRREVGGKPGSA
jgi:hypothetical protein